MARLLTPNEYGLIGMITIFIAISQSFIDSGFSQALIRKIECSEDDYTTVYYFNRAVGIFLYLVLFATAVPISRFFHEEKLVMLVRVVGINLIISSFGLIQRTILTKNINFKLQAKISVIASSISGVIGIALAYSGFGVWSLVVKTIAQNLCTVLLLWIGNKWQSRGTFSRKSFKELYGFGSKLLLSGLLDTAYRNIFYLVIGKYYSAAELGLYTRAEQFKNLPSQNLNSIIWRVSYPVLASIPTEHEQIKAGYKKLIKSTMMITFVLMLSMAAVAPNMIIVLIGEKWLQSAVYLQLLCFVSMFYPLSALNLNMLKVKGRSDLFLKLEIIKRVTAVPTIIIGIFWGIKIMILSMMVKALIDYYLNSYYSGTLINYRVTEQIKDILPGLGVAAMTASGIYTFGFALVHHLTPTNLFLVQIIVGTTLFFSINELAKLKDYLYLKEIAMHIIGFGKP